MFIFIYLCLAVLVFVAASPQASHCGGFSCCKVRALGCVGFINCGSQALERGLNNCGTQASLLRGVWNLPGSGIEPVSPALAGRFFTTELPGKPPETSFLLSFPKFVDWPGNRMARSKDLSLSRMETAFRCGGHSVQQGCLSPSLLRPGKVIPPNRASWRPPSAPPRHEVLLRMVQGLLFSVSCTWMMMFLSPPSGGRLNTSGNDEGPSEMRQWQIHLWLSSLHLPTFLPKGDE